jgi:hypothetical protein
MVAAWRRTRDATLLWLRHRGVLGVPALPLVFVRYALSPLAAVRALSDAREVVKASEGQLEQEGTYGPSRVISGGTEPAPRRDINRSAGDADNQQRPSVQRRGALNGIAHVILEPEGMRSVIKVNK